jgi:hypothetical protein
MDVRVDQGGHHCLSCEIDPPRAGWRQRLSFPADPGEAVVLDDERGVFDRRTAVADDESGAFKQRYWRGRGLVSLVAQPFPPSLASIISELRRGSP